MTKAHEELSYRVYQVTYRWLPLTLPIFGKYNDYQGMEHVIHNENTDLIEKTMGVNIDIFARDILNTEIKIDGYEEIRPCWIRRDVWDLMNHIDSNGFYDLGLSDVIGHEEVLLNLGFKKIDDTSGLEKPMYGTERFNKAYELDGKIVWSDGGFLSECSMTRAKWKKMFPSINKDILFSSPIRLMGNADLAYMLPLIQISEYMTQWRDLSDRLGRKIITSSNEYTYDLPRTTMSDAYFSIIMDGDLFFRDLFYELYCVFINARKMSTILEPMLYYVTPQCGEDDVHLKFAKEFVKILKKEVRLKA
jgi:hypothetical protein